MYVYDGVYICAYVYDGVYICAYVYDGVYICVYVYSRRQYKVSVTYRLSTVLYFKKNA